MLKHAPFILFLAGSTLSAAVPASNLFAREGNVDTDICSQTFGPGDHTWTTIPCTIAEVVQTGFKYSARERWMAAHATEAFAEAQRCWLFSQSTKHSFSQTVSNFLHGPDGMRCEILDVSSGLLSGCTNNGNKCDEAGHPAG